MWLVVTDASPYHTYWEYALPSPLRSAAPVPLLVSQSPKICQSRLKCAVARVCALIDKNRWQRLDQDHEQACCFFKLWGPPAAPLPTPGLNISWWEPNPTLDLWGTGSQVAVTEPLLLHGDPMRSAIQGQFVIVQHKQRTQTVGPLKLASSH